MTLDSPEDRSPELSTTANGLKEPRSSVAEQPKWFYSKGKTELGPVSDSQMRSLLESGAISPKTLLWKDGMPDWIHAQGIPEFQSRRAPAFPPKTTVPPIFNQLDAFCSNCGNAVSSKAVACTACGVAPRGEKHYCYNCGVPVNVNQIICVQCGVGLTVSHVQPSANPSNTDKNTAAILALVLGGLGAHKFYYGSWGWGVIYICFCVTFVPAGLAFLEGIMLLFMARNTYDERYNLQPSSPFKW